MILLAFTTKVGIEPPESTVSESVGTVNITIGLISGTLCGEMEVSFSIDNSRSDAIGKPLFS